MSLKFCKAALYRIPEAFSLSYEVVCKATESKKNYSFILVAYSNKKSLSVIKPGYCFPPGNAGNERECGVGKIPRYSHNIFAYFYLAVGSLPKIQFLGTLVSVFSKDVCC